MRKPTFASIQLHPTFAPFSVFQSTRPYPDGLSWIKKDLFGVGFRITFEYETVSYIIYCFITVFIVTDFYDRNRHYQNMIQQVLNHLEIKAS